MAFYNPFKTALALANSAPEVGVASPWSPTPSHLQSIALADIFGAEALLPITRGDCMRVPSVVKARALITSASRYPLKAYKDGTELETQPTWLSRTNSQVSPQQRMLWTLDDILFIGWSLWGLERGAQGQITDAIRVPPDMWKFNSVGEVEVNGEPVKADDCILFSGPQEGFTTLGSRTVRAYQDLESTRASRLRNPIASIVLKETSDTGMEREEINALVQTYADNHNSSSMSVSFLPHNIDVEEHGTASPELFIQAENAINVQVAQLTNVPATLLDASVEGSSSLTYQNTEQNRSWFIDQTISYWVTIIEARLSLDDVTPRGTYIQFDLSDYTQIPSNGGPQLED